MQAQCLYESQSVRQSLDSVSGASKVSVDQRTVGHDTELNIKALGATEPAKSARDRRELRFA